MLNRDIFVVLGAGASSAAATDFAGSRPPLTAELFDPRFNPILNNYPMARNAAPDIRDAIDGARGEPAVSLEELLRSRYYESDDELNRRRYFSVVAYLQHVLYETSHRSDVHFDNLDRLCNLLLEDFRRVVFVTLNYDIALDRCLAQFGPLRGLPDFISDPRWALVKLHGSITWGHRILEPLSIFDPPSDTDERLDQDLVHTWSLNLEELRVGRIDTSSFQMFPALSAPLGEDDQIICPPAHQEFLDARLNDADKVHLLVIGYSGLDRSVREKLWSARGKVSSLSIVDADRKRAEQVLERIRDDLGVARGYAGVYLGESGFASWIRSGVGQWRTEVAAIDVSGAVATTW